MQLNSRKSLVSLQTPGDAFRIGFIINLAVGLLLIYFLAPRFGIGHAFFGGVGHDGYLELADNLAHGNGYVFTPDGPPVFHRPPLYPLILTPLTCLPAPMQRPALLILHSIMVGFICLALFSLTERLFNRVSGRAAVILFLANPMLYLISINPMIIIVQTTLYLILGSIILYKLIGDTKAKFALTETSSSKAGAILGVIAAALILLHSSMQLTIAFLFVALLIKGLKTSFRRELQTVCISAIVIVMLIAPWTWRNYRVLNDFLPVSGNAGIAYFYGNAHWGINKTPVKKGVEDTYAAVLRHLEFDQEPDEVIHFFGFNDYELEKQSSRRLKQDLISNPLGQLKKIALNALEYYFPIIHPLYLRLVAPPAMSNLSYGVVLSIYAKKVIISLIYAIFLGLAGYKILHLRRFAAARKIILLLFLLITAAALPYFPFLTAVVYNQYNLVPFPFLCLLAAMDPTLFTAESKG